MESETCRPPLSTPTDKHSLEEIQEAWMVSPWRMAEDRRQVGALVPSPSYCEARLYQEGAGGVSAP